MLKCTDSWPRVEFSYTELSSYLFAFGVAHLVPMRHLLLARRVVSQREPADHLLLALQRLLVIHGRHQGHVGQLEERHLDGHNSGQWRAIR